MQRRPGPRKLGVSRILFYRWRFFPLTYGSISVDELMVVLCFLHSSLEKPSDLPVLKLSCEPRIDKQGRSRYKRCFVTGEIEGGIAYVFWGSETS